MIVRLPFWLSGLFLASGLYMESGNALDPGMEQIYPDYLSCLLFHGSQVLLAAVYKR